MRHEPMTLFKSQYVDCRKCCKKYLRFIGVIAKTGSCFIVSVGLHDIVTARANFIFQVSRIDQTVNGFLNIKFIDPIKKTIFQYS